MLRRSGQIAGTADSTSGRAIPLRSADQQLILLILGLLAARLLLYALVVGAFTTLPGDLCVWDCAWFLRTSQAGYDLTPTIAAVSIHGQANWVNFPVFPGLIHVFSKIVPVSSYLAGFIVANSALAVFVYFAVKYLDRVAVSSNRAAAAVFLMAFPYGFYFSLTYGESTYAALAMAAFYFLARGNILSSALFAAFLSATRVTGVLFTPIIVGHYLCRAYQAYRAQGRAAGAAILWSGVFPVALAPLGLFLFMFYLYCHMGDAFAFLHVQRGWGRTEQDPLIVLANGLLANDLGNTFASHTHSETYAALCALAGMGLSARLLALQRYGEAWFLLASILIAMSEGFLSFPRYCLANPIFMTWLFELFWSRRLRKSFVPIVFICLCLQLYLVHLWMRHLGSLI